MVRKTAMLKMELENEELERKMKIVQRQKEEYIARMKRFHKGEMDYEELA